MPHSIAFALVSWFAVTAAAAGEIRLTVEEPAGVDRQQWPVSSGIPFAQGALTSDQAAALFDAAGSEIPLQTETLARWPDGSIRWLLLDFQIDLAAKQKKMLTLRYGSGIARAAVEKPVRVARQAGGKVTIDTGVVRVAYDPDNFMPQGETWLTGGQKSDQQVTHHNIIDGVSLVDETGVSMFPLAGKAEITVEQAGPVRVCIRVNGWHWRMSGDRRMFRYVARIHAWRGQPYIRVYYTFINDCQDVLMTKITALLIDFWRYSETQPDSPNTACILDGKPVAKGGKPVAINTVLQVDENHYLLNGKPAGARACGWAAAGSDRMGLAVGLREFWQNWPKGITCTPDYVRLNLCPELPKGLYAGKALEEENKLYYAMRDSLYTFKVGVAKTHEFWVNYFAGKPDAKRLGAFFQAAEEPLLAVAEPEHVSRTKALGDFPPADPQKYLGYDAWFDRALEAHLKRREQIREYGMLNYGDWYGERKVNWGNLEYDLAHGMFAQYLRTGDRRYYLRGEQAARHHIDVDVVHAVNPLLKNPWGPPPQVGEIWLHCLNHTGGYYENAPLPVDRTYQMGHSTNFGHVWVGGDFEYYYLTGDRRAKEVAIEIADAMARNCPTSYGTHIRGLGWPIVLLINAYEATGDKKYLDAATSCWEVLKKNIDWQKGWVVQLAKDHCYHGDRRCYGNVPFMEGLTVSGLVRYHRVTQDPEVLRAISVGLDQMIRECWEEDDKAFRYTACPKSTRKTYNSLCLAAEAFAYEGTLTGNREHLRILREGLGEVLRRPSSGDGKSWGQMIHFTPYALRAVEQE